MKRLFTLIALLMVSVAVTPIVEAKRFGGGKSFGKSYRTAPAPKQQQQNTSTLNKDKSAAQGSSKKGLMGGILGGLLAGGLLAALFGSGAFEGLQFMDILIVGLVAFLLFKLMRGLLAAKQGSMNQSRTQPAFGGNTSQFEPANVHNFEQQPSSSVTGGFGHQTDVPHNYPAGFDQVAFLNGAREHYRILQGAWNHNELNTIEEYVAPALFDELKQERAKLNGEQHTDVMFVDAEIVRADYDANKAQLSLQFTGRYRDVVEGVEEDIQDIWHLERDLTTPNAPWLIVGIQS